MKALKIALAVVGGAILLVLLAIVVLAATFDAEKYKPDIIKVVKDKTGRTLKIDGPIGLSVFPRLGLTLEKIELSEPENARTFARLGQVKGSLAIMPLLSREVVVDKIVVTGLAADLVRHKDGSTNFDDLMSGGKDGGNKGNKGGKGNESGNAGASGPNQVNLDIEGVDIAADSLGWRDERDGTQLRLSDFSLKTGRIGDDVPGKLELAARIQGSQPKMDVKISLASGYRFAFDRGAFALDGLALNVKGDLPGAAGANFSVKGNIESDPQKGLLKVDGLEAAAKTADGLDATLGVPSLLSAPGKNTEGSATLTFKLDRPGVSLQGKVSSPVSASAEAKTLQLKHLSGEVNASGSSIPQKALKLTLDGALDANWGKKTAAGRLEAKVDASTLKSQFNVNAAGSVPAIGFSLDIDQLDLDRYLSSGADGGKPGGSAGADAKGEGGADKPMDLSALRSLNLNGQIRAARITAHKVKLEKFATALRVGGGRLDISALSASLYGGTVAGSASLDAGGHAAVKKQLSGVNIGPLLRDAIGKDFIEGHGNVALDVTTVGLTVPAMKKALAGSASLSLRDGAVKGINLADSFRKAKSLLGAKGAQEQAASKTDQTDFSELSASFRIHDGIAHNDDLSLKSPFIRLGGSGDVNIGADSVDYLAKASIVDTSGGQGGKDLAELKGLTVPVRLSGPFDALKYRIDFGAMATEAVKQKVEEKVKDQLQDRLKGLFKR